jgi:MFS family permease
LAQALRAFAYGFGAVLLGVTFDERGFSSFHVGLVLTAVVAGTVVMSVAVARWGDRFGRRCSYVCLYLILAATGAVFAASSPLWALVLVALAGGLSTEVVESGPFTSLEQSMISAELSGQELVRGFGLYNAVATAAGSIGALAAGLPGLLRGAWSGTPADDRFFIVLSIVAVAGAVVAATLSRDVEVTTRTATPAAASTLGRSKSVVRRLSSLFAMDSFGGGFVVQAFIAYWLTVRFGASVELIGVVFFVVGVLQTVSFLCAPALARRYGLLHTMVFTHLPSNLLLAAMAFAPTLPIAIGLLLARVALSQMDVPTRQAYVMALVDPDERTPAAAYTNTARYVVRPTGPLLAGAASSLWLGLPFLAAGTIKGAYDLILWRWFRTVPLPEQQEPTGPTAAPIEALEDNA